MVVPVDPFDDRDLELAARSPWAVKLDQFGFEGAVEGFRHRIVVAVSNGADRGCQAGVDEAVGVADRGVLTGLK